MPRHPSGIYRPYHATLRSLTSLEFTRTFITGPREWVARFGLRSSRASRKHGLLQGINKVHACAPTTAAQVCPCDVLLMCYVLIYRNAPFATAESSASPRFRGILSLSFSFPAIVPEKGMILGWIRNCILLSYYGSSAPTSESHDRPRLLVSFVLLFRLDKWRPGLKIYSVIYNLSEEESSLFRKYRDTLTP